MSLFSDRCHPQSVKQCKENPLSCHPFPLKLLPTCEHIGLPSHPDPTLPSAATARPHTRPTLPHPKVARNSPRTSFIGSSKPRNINDLISNPETFSRELRAKLLSCTRFLGRPARRPPRGLRGNRGVTAALVGGVRARAGLEIDHSERSSRVAISRAAGPNGARNTSGATSTAGDLAGPQPQQAVPRAAAAQ